MMEDKIEVRQTNETAQAEEVARLQNLGYFLAGTRSEEDGNLTQVLLRDLDHD